MSSLRLVGLVAALVPVVSVLGCSKQEAPPPPANTLAAATTTTTTTIPPVSLEVKVKTILDAEVPSYRQCLQTARAKNPYAESKPREGKAATIDEAKANLDGAMANANQLLKHMQAENKCYDGFVAQVKPKLTEAGATAAQAEATFKPLGKERRCARCQ